MHRYRCLNGKRVVIIILTNAPIAKYKMQRRSVFAHCLFVLEGRGHLQIESRRGCQFKLDNVHQWPSQNFRMRSQRLTQILFLMFHILHVHSKTTRAVIGLCTCSSAIKPSPILGSCANECGLYAMNAKLQQFRYR